MMPPSNQSTTVPVGPWSNAIVAVLVLWMILPMALLGRFAQDGTAFTVAADLFAENPEVVYPQAQVQDAPPSRIEQRYCERAARADCAAARADFVSPPPFLAVVAPLTWLPTWLGVLVQRVAAAAMLAASVVVLWRRLPRANDGVLFAALAMLTPLVVHTLVLGQNTPLLVLSAALGTTATSTRGRMLRGALWGVAATAKLFPLALGGVLVLRRRWTMLLAGISLVAVLSAFVTILEPGLWASFRTVTGKALDVATRNPYVVSFDSALPRVWPSARELATPSFVLRAGLLGFVWWRWGRRLTQDIEWAWAYAAVASLSANAWPHYFLILIPALVLAVGTRRDKTRWLLPAFAAVGAIAVLTWGSSAPATVVVPGAYLATVLVVPILGVRPTKPSPVDVIS